MATQKGYAKNKSVKRGFAIASDLPEMKPMLNLGSDDLKEVKSWDVGKTYDLEVTVKMTSKHLASDGETTGNFEVEDVNVNDEGNEDKENGNS